MIYVYGDMDEDGFFMGELHGRRGLVPSNFLTEAPADYRTKDSSHISQRGEERGPDKGVNDIHNSPGHGPGSYGPPPPPREHRQDGGQRREGKHVQLIHPCLISLALI